MSTSVQYLPITKSVDPVDLEIAEYLNLSNPKSFFLFAGAGSGKTRSLVNALNHIRINHGRELILNGQRVAVITYTNAACDEIISRLNFSPLFVVSTIHSFAWELIKGLNRDIKAWLKTTLEADIVDLQEKERRGRAGKASLERQASIATKMKRLERLPSIRSFVYSPTGENREPNSLNHSEVIELCSHFLRSKPLMRDILVSRFPFLLVDESQDTKKELVEALFAVAQEREGKFALGFLGDVMQRIYLDGKERMDQGLPSTWGKPAKLINYRCPRRVVDLINKIRSEVDCHQQQPCDGAADGHVRLFVVNRDGAGRADVEAQIRARMAELTGDQDWQRAHACKHLTLEHHMAARRLGFDGLLLPLLEIEDWRTSLLDGSFAPLRILTDNVLPLISAARAKDRFKVARILRERSPLLSAQHLKDCADPKTVLNEAQHAIEQLESLWQDADPKCIEVIELIAATGLFPLPEALLSILAMRAGDVDAGAPGTTELPSPEALALLQSLTAPFGQLESYRSYVAGEASFDTHQGVKGLEFDRVLVIMDDEEARGFLFSFDKLFGAKDLTETDLRNRREGRDSSLDRTRRLLYVTCSRAKKSLALIAYTDNPETVLRHVVANAWFKANEVERIS